MINALFKRFTAMALAEVESELWSARIRIGLSAGYAILAAYSYLSHQLSISTLITQLCALTVLFMYSCWYLSRRNRQRLRAWTYFIFVAIDVAAVTLILMSYALTHALSMPFHSAFFSAYLVVIMLYALQDRRSLPILCGLLSLGCYSIVGAWIPLTYAMEGAGTDYLARVGLLAVVSALAAIVSGRNNATKNKVISSELRYQKLVHRLPEMLFTVDGRGAFLWANAMAKNLLGIPSNVICGRTIRDFMVEPDLLKLDKTEFRATFQIKDLSGALKYVDCYIQPIREEGKQPIFEGIMTDVTDREIALFQREEMVTRLYQYQKMESLGTLATGMAHDFNNILQTVSDTVTIVERETSETSTKKRMSVISESLIDAKFLITELLALGRKRPLDFKPLHIQPLVQSIVTQYQNQLGEQYVIKASVQEEPLWIQGDADYLKRIFQNLIGNARDAMPGGGAITIECFLQKYVGKAPTVVVRIKDTGTGIPAKIKDKVFDPFFTTKKPGKGTGLGLALVQRIVSLHNGTVVIEKTDAAGTVFRIDIPEKQREETDVDTKEILLNRRSTRVLILDDDPKIRGILKFFLAEFSYPICEASDIEEGARELRKHVNECELVIMDWKLGTDDPHAAIKSLRDIKPDLIVIVVSGYPPRADSIKSMNIFKWIIKPYDKNQLDVEIQRALYFQEKKR